MKGLSKCILEYVSSGRNMGNAELGRELNENESIESLSRWLSSFGVRRVDSYNSDEFDISRSKTPVFWSGYQENYKRNAIRLMFPNKKKENFYQFEIFFDKETDKIDRIWAYEGVFSVMVRYTIKEKLDFIKKCLS